MGRDGSWPRHGKRGLRPVRGDNFKPMMTTQQARDVVMSEKPSEADMIVAITILQLSPYFGDQMVAHELRKVKLLNKVTR